MKIYLCDHEQSFTSGLVAHWERQGHDVTISKEFDLGLAASADLIFCEWLDPNAIALTNAGRRWGARTIARCHRYEVDANFLAKVNFDILDDVIFVSPTWEQKAREKYPNLRQTRTHIIPNGVDINKYTFQEHGHGNVVGIVAILRPLVQPELILDIARAYPDMEFRIAGLWADWADKRYIRQWREVKPENVKCLGWVDDMVSFYDGIDYYLNTKNTECFGFGIAEAMSRGIKPLLYDAEGIRDHWPDWLIWQDLGELDALFHGPYESKKYHRYVRRYSLSRMCKAIDELIEVKRPLVSLTMIAKNEENTLEAAVESARPYVDEVVIGVDDKSEDKTLEIARRVADVTYEFEFIDFADARNKAIEHSSGDWWMCIDAHEIFRNANDWSEGEDEEGNSVEIFDPKDDFRGWLRGCPAPSVDCHVFMDRDKYGVPALNFLFPRLCRWWARWVKGRSVHNIPNVGGGPARRDWQMYHERGKQAQGARKERDAQRGSMNVFELRQRIKENPKDARSLFYEGNSLRELGEWLMALWCYQEALKWDSWQEQRAWSRWYSAQCLLQLKRPLEAKEMILASLHDDPVRAEPFAMLGDLAYSEQKFGEALFWFQIAASIPIPQNRRLFIQTPLYEWMALDKASMAAHHVGNYELAIEFAERVYKVRKEPRIENNIKEFKKALAKKMEEKTNGT